MTYAGLKSMIYAGLTPDDPRVKAAYDYITKNYTLDENPGLGQQGPVLLLPDLRQGAWPWSASRPSSTPRAGRTTGGPSSIAALAKRQGADGSWVNPADRFMEGDPNLVTAYGLLALAYARPEG